MFISFSSMKPGDRGKIFGFWSGDRAYRQKLLAMGLTPNAEFEIIRYAPLGDPVQIRVRNCYLSLRKTEASILKIVRDGCES